MGRRGGDVFRYHTEFPVRSQSNAHHQWNVALLVQYFYPNASKELLLVALQHDIAEVSTGDTPFTAKRERMNLALNLASYANSINETFGFYDETELDKEEHNALWVCDVLEAVVFAYEEVLSGNRWMEPVFHRADDCLTQADATPNRVHEFLTELRNNLDGCS